MARPLRGESGFTLIELLTACAVVSVLAAFAIPQFASYWAEGFNTLAENDIRSLAYAQEAHFAHTGVYVDDVGSLDGFRVSPGVDLETTASDASFIIKASHPSGSRVYYWDSSNGGMQDAS